MEQNNDPWQRTWKRWRGSPALFAHVARVVKDAVNPALNDSNYLINVFVGGDIELFETPEEFKDNVTPEALRNFTTVHVEARDPTIHIRLEFHQAVSAVRLRVESKDHPDKADAVREEVVEAIKRGVLTWFHTIIFVLGAAVIGLVAIVSINYLSKVPQAQGIFRNSALRQIISSVPGVLFTGLLLFARRQVEIAEVGQTRLWRMIRFIGPVVTGVAIAAITKLLLKSG